MDENTATLLLALEGVAVTAAAVDEAGNPVLALVTAWQDARCCPSCGTRSTRDRRSDRRRKAASLIACGGRRLQPYTPAEPYEVPQQARCAAYLCNDSSTEYDFIERRRDYCRADRDLPRPSVRTRQRRSGTSGCGRSHPAGTR